MIMKWDDFEPLASIPAKGACEGICELKFTPEGAAKPMLAAASHDQHIYIYSVSRGYQCAAIHFTTMGTQIPTCSVAKYEM